MSSFLLDIFLDISKNKLSPKNEKLFFENFEGRGPPYIGVVYLVINLP